MDAATSLQWGLLWGYAALVVGAFLIGWRWKRLRPLAFFGGLLAGTHALYYALFLAWPAALDGRQTMIASIVIRYQVLFTVALGLGLAAMRERWR